MKRFRDPNAAIQPPEADLPLSEKIFCAVFVTIVVVWAVWISVGLK